MGQLWLLAPNVSGKEEKAQWLFHIAEGLAQHVIWPRVSTYNKVRASDSRDLEIALPDMFEHSTKDRCRQVHPS